MSALAEILRRRIRDGGPIDVAAYMDLALAHPRHGYYRNRDPLGRAGDFVTAPEISQMFGEIIGLWCVVVWRMMGAPDRLRLIELGPGRGTLMADLLRAAAVSPEFVAAARIHLVETSPVLRRAQRRALSGRAVRWHDRFDSVPAGPTLLVANEFFDALPIRQYVRDGGLWRERLVDVAGDGFAFVAGPPAAPDLPPAMADAAEGAIAEISPAGRAVAAALGARLAREGGAALIIDYGPAASACGDSLQAVRRHAYHAPLADPGDADLTAHVDFASLAAAARPALAHGPLPQGVWLRRLGIETRAARLAAADPAGAATIRADCTRLIAPEEMGTLFKAMALADPRLPALPGFESP